METKTRPFNPFINAGAITVASCIQGKDADEKSAVSGIYKKAVQ
ncbi:MAG: glutaminase [Lachnospiraceae bacterium]